jgi:O-antigen ligase
LAPASIQQRYHITTNIFLFLFFIDLWAKKGKPIFKRSDFSLWVFLIAIGLNVFFAQQRNAALGTYLNIFLPMLSIYYLVSENFSDEASFSDLVKTISIFSILVALLGMAECVFRFNPIYQYLIDNSYYRRYITGFVRPMSTQFNPVVLGSYLIASLPFNFLLFKQNKSLWKILGAVGIVLNTVVIILTFSRSIFLGLIGMIIFYLFLGKKFRALFAFSISLLILTIVVTYLPYPFNRFGINLMTTGSFGMVSDYRFQRCAMVGRIIKEHPFVGIGFQHVRIRFYEYYPYRGRVPYEFMIPDNMYLTILAETGIVGFLGFFIFIFSIFKKAQRKLKILSAAPQKKQELLLILSAFVGLSVNMAGYELFYWPNPYIYFCILIGLIEADYRNPGT